MKRAALVGATIVALLAAALGALVLALQAPHLDVPARRDWLFQDVILVEPGRPPQPRSRLRIEDGVIAERGALRHDAPPDQGPELDTRDLAGLYVSPGLSDLHVHYPPRIAVGNDVLWSLLLLAHGVTSIRETGSIDGSIFDVRDRVRAGRVPGPRIFACGEMLDGDPPSFPSNRIVVTPEQARAAVTSLAERGADCVKTYNMLSADVLAAIREAAAEVGLPVIGHMPHAVDLEEAGIVDLQHGTGAVEVDRQRVGRQDFRWEDWLSLDDERIAHVARVSLAQDIAHTPTLVNGRMRRLLAAEESEPDALRDDTGLRHLPRFWTRAWRALWEAPFVRGDARSEAVHEVFRQRQAEMTGRLHAAGVRIHAGTDTLMPFVAPGSSLHGELADLVAAGIEPAAVWEIATREAGRSLGLPGLGTLEVGAPADLLFLRSDPAQGVAALGEIEAVLADGRLYRRADLDALLAAADAHFRGALYTGVMEAVVAVAQRGFAPERDEPAHFGGQP